MEATTQPCPIAPTAERTQTEDTAIEVIIVEPEYRPRLSFDRTEMGLMGRSSTPFTAGTMLQAMNALRMIYDVYGFVKETPERPVLSEQLSDMTVIESYSDSLRGRTLTRISSWLTDMYKSSKKAEAKRYYDVYVHTVIKSLMDHHSGLNTAWSNTFDDLVNIRTAMRKNSDCKVSIENEVIDAVQALSITEDVGVTVAEVFDFMERIPDEPGSRVQLRLTQSMALIMMLTKPHRLNQVRHYRTVDGGKFIRHGRSLVALVIKEVFRAQSDVYKAKLRAVARALLCITDVAPGVELDMAVPPL